MRSKLWFLVKVSLKRKFKSKTFVISNIALLVLLAFIMNIDTIVNIFDGDFHLKRTIYVIDKVGAYESFKENLSASALISFDKEEDTYDIVKTDKELDDLKKEYENPDIKKEFWIVVFEPNSENIIDVTIVSETYIDTLDYQIILGAINNTKTLLAINDLHLEEAETHKLFSQVEVKREIVDETKKSDEEAVAGVMTSAFPFIILPFFFLSFYLTQSIGSEVNDEKTTRGMEVIISSVSPEKHFLAKMIAGNFFILVQALMLVVYSGIGLLIRANTSTLVTGNFDAQELVTNFMQADVLSNLTAIIPALLFLMILTFIGYSLLAGILASVTTNAEDFQHMQTPIYTISMLGYYLAIIAGFFKGSAFIKALSYCPFISAVLSPSLLVIGDAGVIDFIISSLIMILFDYLLAKYGMRIYKVGVLNYSSEGLWKKMFNALKQK